MLTRSVHKAAKLPFTVIHDTVGRAFRAKDSVDKELGYVEYRFHSTKPIDTIEFFHTYTSPEARGTGVGAAVVERGLEWAKSNSYVVIPSCSYVATFMEKNSQYQSLL